MIIRFAFLLVASICASAAPVRFRAEIAPLLHRRCATCHNEENAKGRYRLDSFARLAKAGESDLAPLVPGKARESELYLRLVESDAHDRMPQKADALPPAEIALIERWIAEGAANDGGAADRPLVELARETLLRPAPEKYARAQPVTALAFSPDGTQIAVSGYYEVTVWNLADATLARRIGGLPERITALAWHPRRNVLAVAGGSPGQWGAVALVDPAQDWQPRILCDLADTALSVAFSPDGTQLAAGAADRAVRFFDPASGKTTRVLRQHADWVQSVAFDRDGARLVTASRDRTARIFNARTGALETTFSGHESPVLGAVFSNSGSQVYSFARGRSVLIWDAASGEAKKESIDLDGGVQQILATPFGLVTGGTDPLVRVLQISDRRLLFTLHGHGDGVPALALSPDGQTFASGGADGTVCVWSIACGTWTQRFTASPL